MSSTVAGTFTSVGREALIRLGLGPSEIARATGLTKQAIYNYLTGRSTPNEIARAAIQRVYGIAPRSWDERPARAGQPSIAPTKPEPFAVYDGPRTGDPECVAGVAYPDPGESILAFRVRQIQSNEARIAAGELEGDAAVQLHDEQVELVHALARFGESEGLYDSQGRAALAAIVRERSLEDIATATGISAQRTANFVSGITTPDGTGV